MLRGAGPVKIGVKSTQLIAAADLHACELASERCASTTSPGLLACVDELFERDGTCRKTTDNIGSTFGHFVALPPPTRVKLAVPAATE